MCYRARRRAQERAVDRNNPGLRREHLRMVKGWSNLMASLGELRVTREDALRIRDIAAPYVAPVSEFLSIGRERELSDVHVHGSTDEPDDPEETV